MSRLQTKLRVLRAECNMTQEELADRVGVVRQTIVYLEKGEYMPSLGLAWRIAQLFNQSIEAVFQFVSDSHTGE